MNKAYTWNEKTGLDFCRELPQWNLLTRSNLRFLKGDTSEEPDKFDPSHYFKLNALSEVDKTGQFPSDWHRPYSLGIRLYNPKNASGTWGWTYWTHWEKLPVKPNLTQGNKMGVSMRLTNFGRKPLDFNLKLLYGNTSASVGTYTVEPWQYVFVSELVTLQTTETAKNLGLTVELDSTGQEEQIGLFFPKIEMDKVTPYVTTEEEYNYFKSQDMADSRPVYTGYSETDSNDFKDYVWGGQLNDENYELFGGDTKQNAVWCYCYPLNQRVLIGIDSDTYTNASGRTVNFHVLNGSKSVFDMTGNTLYPEQFQDERQAFDGVGNDWATIQEPLYVVDQNTAIDPVAGEMANVCIEGYHYQQASQGYKVDEVVRSAILNVGYSLGSYYVNEDSVKEVDVMRSRVGVTPPQVFGEPSYSGMNDWMTTYGLPNGFIMRPWKVRMVDTETNLTKIKGISIGWNVSLFQKFLATDHVTEDWFRSYDNKRTKAIPDRVLFINDKAWRAWLYKYNPTKSAWERSVEYTIPIEDTALLKAWTIVPKDGAMNGHIVFTDKTNAEMLQNIRPNWLDYDEFTPKVQYDEVKYNPQMFTNLYNTRYQWWGIKDENPQNQSYGPCVPYEMDFMTGLCKLERIYE
ncbi:hypothetical protein 135ceduo_00035 [Lactococcus phage STA135]|nr:hypothetical protein 135ceduo_00035 [Lactococcus phage STA135]